MRSFRLGPVLVLCLTLVAPASLAQEPPADTGTTPPADDTGGQRQGSSSADRLFLNFIEDGTIVDNQWWEGNLVYAEGEAADATLLSGQVAFQPWRDLELGARVAFGSTDTQGPIPEGTGATDLDVWAKYRFPPGARTEFTVGGVLTVPTGDESAGLGADAFGVSVFGAMRYRFRRFVFSGNLGAQFNEDGRVLGSGIDLDGQTAPFVGAAAMFFITDRITLVAEGRWRSERFEGVGDDSQLLGGLDWHVSPRGVLRAAVGFGVSSAAPDVTILAGYAFNL